MMNAELDYALTEDCVDTLYSAFQNIYCLNIEPDFDEFENIPLPKGVFFKAGERDVEYVIVGVGLDTVDGVRGVWATMRPYHWPADMQQLPAFNSKEKFRIAVVEGAVNQSVLFAVKRINSILEDSIMTWEPVETDGL